MALQTPFPFLMRQAKRSTPFRRNGIWFVPLAIFGLHSFAGCQHDETGLGNLPEVTGEVSFEGGPTPGAVLEFVPQEIDDPEEIIRTFAVVGEDGRFSARTVVPAGSKRGAPPGVYSISISWQIPLDPADKDSDMGPELLPEKYQNVQTSGLLYEVKSFGNEVPPIELIR